MTDNYLLAVDIGTSATKAVLFDAALSPRVVIRKSYPVLVPQRGRSEQEPEVILQAVIGALREGCQALPQDGRLLSVVFSSQMYSLLAVDSLGVARSRSLTWSDTRSAEAARSILSHPDATGLAQRTGCPVDPIYPLAKIRWLKDNLHLPADVKFISIKEYVLFHLTGRFLVDWSIASATGLFNIASRAWDPAALSLLGVTPDQLSELVSPRQVLQAWKPDVIAQAGLPAGVALVIGGGDGPLASLGVGAVSPDILAVNVGSSAAARVAIAQPWTDPQSRLWTYTADDDLWVLGGIVSSGGIVWDWFLNTLGSSGQRQPDLYAEIDRLAGTIPPGAEGLLFIPYLGGEQCPGWDPATRGGFWGLDFKHQRSHLARAVLEGITRSIYRVAETITAVSPQPFREVRVTGGLTASPLWLQIAADMFNLPVLVPETVEGSARGAAMLAMLSLGLKTSLEDFKHHIIAEKCTYPREEVHTLYREQHQAFLEILEATRTHL